MKKILLFSLFAFPAIVHAGTRTLTFGTGGGTITIATGPLVAYVPLIVYDSSTSSGFVSGGSPLTWNITIGTNNNMYLAVGCSQRNGDSITGVTVGGSAMTLVSSGAASVYSSYMYGKTAPGSGSKAIAVTAGSGISDRTVCNAISFSGVDQTTPVDVSTTATNNISGAVTTATRTTTRNNDMLFDELMDGNADTLTQGAGQSPLTNFTLAGSYAFAASTKTVTTAGSYSMTWSGIQVPATQTMIAIQPSLTP